MEKVYEFTMQDSLFLDSHELLIRAYHIAKDSAAEEGYVFKAVSLLSGMREKDGDAPWIYNFEVWGTFLANPWLDVEIPWETQ